MNSERVKDFEQKRSDYLRKKTVGNTLTAVGACIAVRFGIAAVGLGFGFFMFGYSFVKAQKTYPEFLLWILAWAAPLGLFAWLGRWLFRSSAKKVAELPYVAPVDEQIAALTEQAILLRGSEEPDALPGELLRAARAGNVASAEDLLRPTEDVDR